LTFLSRVSNHAIAYGFDPELAFQDSQKNSTPSPFLLLATHLAREFAATCSLSAKENTNSTIERIRNSPGKANISEEELKRELANDAEYLLEQAVGGMSLVFADFIGYILFKALGSDVHKAGRSILSTGTWGKLFNEFEPKQLVDGVRREDFETDDLLAIFWHAFRHCISEMLGGSWKELYAIARSRSRFFHSIETRKRLYSVFDNLDVYMKKTVLTRVWAAGIPQGKGLIGHVRSFIERK
jgi:hypothetical protein